MIHEENSPISRIGFRFLVEVYGKDYLCQRAYRAWKEGKWSKAKALKFQKKVIEYADDKISVEDMIEEIFAYTRRR